MLDEHALEQRIAGIRAVLEDFGDLVITDIGKRSSAREVRFDLQAPGQALATVASFKYDEWFVREERGWRLAKYHYDYVDLANGMRLAYHLHDVGQDRDVYHAHCRPLDTDASHLRAYEMSVFEANEEFMRLFAAGRPIDCASFRLLRPAAAG